MTFFNSHVGKKRKSRTGDEYSAILTNHIIPAIGSRRVVDIKRADVGRLHSRLSDKPYLANRALALISAIWNWAAKRDEVLLADNPAKGIERFPEKGRERFLSKDELTRLGAALIEAETTGLPWKIDESKPLSKYLAKPHSRLVKIDQFAIAAIRLLIFTGSRLSEILGTKWHDVDFDRSIIFLPDSKGGKRPVYLSEAALAILSTLPHIEGNPYVIAGSKKNKPRADLKRPWEAVKRAALLEGVRIHDLRHSFASFGVGASLGLPIIGKLLGHKQASTTHRYAHLEADPMHRAVNMIGETISTSLNKMAKETTKTKLFA